MDYLKSYLDRSHDIIGERTPEEVAHDNEVIKQLRKGRNIKKALKMAALKQRLKGQTYIFQKGVKGAHNLNSVGLTLQYFADMRIVAVCMFSLVI
ncbi:MAG: hypothetical protein ABSA06_13140 [Geobacteraceae bacterium]|jgi:hypothetical protein